MDAGASQWGRGFLYEKIVGIKNFSNTSFAGALFQCLYHLPAFKSRLESFLQHKTQNSEIMKLFGELFQSMDQANAEHVNCSAMELIAKLFRKRSQEVKKISVFTNNSHF